MADQELDSSKAIEGSVIKKLMWGLMPFLAFLYMFNMLDRNNVAIAALAFKSDLHFSDRAYALGAGIFYVGYFFFEVPSNLFMQRVGARRWIARIMVSWGAISASMMFMRTPLSFHTLRVLLGIAEAGFYPGIILYITYWVPASVRAQVIARFLALTSVLGIAGGPIGGALLRLDGFQGIRGWQWLFLLEGIPSIILGFVVLKVLPNGPGEATWLTQDEKDWIAGRLAKDNKAEQRVDHASLRGALTDRRVLLLCAIFIITSIAGNSVGFFGPQLIKERSGGLWSDSLVATSMIFPAIVGALAMVIAARHSDRTGRRRSHVVLGYFLAGLAFIACVYAPSAPLVLLALSANALGERCAAGSYWAVTTNLLGPRAAAGGIAFINSVGNLGGFFGPVLMGELKQRSHGSYTAGLYTAGVLMVLGAAISVLLRRNAASTPESLALAAEPAEPVLAAAQPEPRIP
jgi:MFS transporter, ACS family, tartrate transporter